MEEIIFEDWLIDTDGNAWKSIKYSSKAWIFIRSSRTNKKYKIIFSSHLNLVCPEINDTYRAIYSFEEFTSIKEAIEKVDLVLAKYQKLVVFI